MRTGAEVLWVRPDGAAVTLTWLDGGGEQDGSFAGCVLAVLAHVAAKVHGGLDPARAAFLAGVQYTAMVNLVVGLDEPQGEPGDVRAARRVRHPRAARGEPGAQ